MPISIFDCSDIVVCNNCGCVIYTFGAKETEDGYICPACKEGIPK